MSMRGLAEALRPKLGFNAVPDFDRRDDALNLTLRLVDKRADERETALRRLQIYVESLEGIIEAVPSLMLQTAGLADVDDDDDDDDYGDEASGASEERKEAEEDEHEEAAAVERPEKEEEEEEEAVEEDEEQAEKGSIEPPAKRSRLAVETSQGIATVVHRLSAAIGGNLSAFMTAQRQALAARYAHSPAYPLPAAYRGASPSRTLTQLDDFSLEGVARYVLASDARRIVVMSGAGVSTGAGIPDFRTPGKGLYAQVEQYGNLPTPESIFDIEYFRLNPAPFFALCRELWPGRYAPTRAHRLVRALHDAGRLLRNYTQNFDTLERVAGVPPEKLVEAHGSFGDAHCIDCNTRYDADVVRRALDSDATPPRCTLCDGFVKPSITFFGEQLPRRFAECARVDMLQCDLLIIMGTSLSVHPFCSLLHCVPRRTPRLLLNDRAVGRRDALYRMLGIDEGLRYDEPSTNERDVFVQGDVEESCERFATLLGLSVADTAAVQTPTVQQATSPSATSGE